MVSFIQCVGIIGAGMMWRAALFAIAAIFVVFSTLVEGRSSRKRELQEPQINWNEYPSYGDIVKYLKDMAWVHRNRMHLRDVGRSYENRTLQMAVISNGDNRPNKKVIFIDAGLHAREWLCPITALYVIQQLLVEYEVNSYLLDDYDWVLLPLANPDGYEYSRNIDNLWTKTRSPNNEHCYGTNLNKNFNFFWAKDYPALKDPCSEEFAGREPFSEPESRTVRDIMDELMGSKRGFMYLSLHTANRTILYPWNYKANLTKKNKMLQKIAKYATERIYWSTGTQIKEVPRYFYGRGTALDYADNLGFPLAFTFELSGMGRDGVDHKFFPPSVLIRELVQESWLGVRSLAEKAMELSRIVPPKRNHQRNSRPTGKPTRKPTSKPTRKPTRKPNSRRNPKPTSKPTSKPKQNTKPKSQAGQTQLPQNVTLTSVPSETFKGVPPLNSTI